MTTFRGRLTAALAATTAFFLSVFCVVIYLWCRSAFLGDLDGDLQAIQHAELTASDSLESHLRIGQANHGDVRGFEMFGLIAETDGRRIKSTEGLETANLQLPSELLRTASKEGPTFTNLSLNGQTYRVLASPIKLEGRALVEVLGISENPVKEALSELRQGLGLSLLIGIALFSAISYQLAGYLTRPLETILAQLESVTSQGDPALRLPGSFRDREISSLQAQINAMLERLDRGFQLQRRFVSDASHELRAPLSNLTLAIEVCLRRDRGVEDYREVLHTCHGETRRLNEMANSLLTLSQSDEGALALNRDTHDLGSLLRHGRERHALVADERQLELILNSTPVTVWVDESRLAQVLDNVIDNSLRYAPQGSAVELNCAQVEGKAEVRITDHGPGLSPEQSAQLFERFYRADASRQRGTGGAGLGLAIARAIVEAHGGTIAVDSVPNQATTFIIRLPLGEPQPSSK